MSLELVGPGGRERRHATVDAVIASSGNLSSALDLGDFTLVAIQMPSAWDAANLTFEGSADGTQFDDVYDDTGTEYEVSAGPSRLIQVDPVAFLGLRHLKVRSGTTGTPVNQSAERTLTLIVRPV